MAVSAKMYAKAHKSLVSKEANLNTDALKVLLLTSTYVPNQALHQYRSDLTNEVVGAGYTAGGFALTSVAVTTSGLVTTLAAANASWSASTITARYAAIVDTTPATAATQPLISYVDFGADVVSSGTLFSIIWDPSGICSWTAQ